MTTLHTELTPIHVQAGSPRWLTIIRDAALAVAAVLISLALIYCYVMVQRAGNALEEIGNSNTSTSEVNEYGVPCDTPGVVCNGG